MLCDNCGKEGVFVRKVTKSYGKGDDLILIEDVPVIHCPHCHESYLTAQTVHAIGEVKRARRNTRRRTVEVASLE
ncbi:MAG: YgiT-type zinc finger protein [Calditrichaeota bacterium]|nr:YgiT-type zinc finger protein [Calditrichota bacterium]